MAPRLYDETYFGDGVLDAGWMVFPHLLNRHYHQIGLSEEMLVFLLQLMAMRLDPKPPIDLPDIAMRMGKNLKTVRGYSQRLRQLGLIVVTPRYRNGAQIGNGYSLAPLWGRLRKLGNRRRRRMTLQSQLGRICLRVGMEEANSCSGGIQKRPGRAHETVRGTRTQMEGGGCQKCPPRPGRKRPP